jgi:cytochrome c biogenesis protein ResB
MTTRVRLIKTFLMDWLTIPFRLLASLKVAMPLLVLLTAVTIIGSLFPEPDIFRSWWYLALLGVQGVSLLFITILHIPSILRRKGRNALLGVITTHLGILVLIAGIIYGGYTGFRHEIRLVEGEVNIVPDLSFAIRLDELVVEEYREEDFPRVDLQSLPKKRQDSHITLLKTGKPFQTGVAAPGRPIATDGITLLPSISDIGWCFDLLVIDPLDRERTIPIRPWDPPLIRLGDRKIVVHNTTAGDLQRVELFEIEDERPVSLGFAGREAPLELEGNKFTLGPVKRYTGMQVYNRPQEPILVWGSVLMFAGLVWHFYFRHRDRRREGKGDA